MGHPALHDPAFFLLPFFDAHTDSPLSNGHALR
jgi:hypothetical protein